MADNLGFGASNPYLDKSISDSLGDTTRAYNMTTAPAYTSAMVRSGSFGNSGVDQMQAESQRQLQTSLGRQANDMRSNNYQFDQSMDRNVYNDQFNQNQQNFQNGMNVIGMQNQSNQQDLGFGTQMQNTPMNYYQGFSQSAGSLGNGYGTTTGTSSANGSPVMGALGGAQLGNAFMGRYGSQPSSSWGGTSLSGFFGGNGGSGD
jgi:hypothetical protein